MNPAYPHSSVVTACPQLNSSHWWHNRQSLLHPWTMLSNDRHCTGNSWTDIHW